MTHRCNGRCPACCPAPALVAYATAPLGALSGLPRPVRCARCDLPVGVCRCFEEWLNRSAEVFGG